MNTLSLELSQASGVPFYRQLEDQIAELIRAGRLPPGGRLPSVRDLAGQTLVSLITVRRAYADLEQAGLIVRRQGQGTFVADDVVGVSRERALAEAQQALTDVVTRAGQLGMSPAEIVAHVEGLFLKEVTHG